MRRAQPVVAQLPYVQNGRMYLAESVSLVSRPVPACRESSPSPLPHQSRQLGPHLDVAPSIHLVPARLLRAHVRRGADRQAGLGGAVAGAGSVESLGDPKVGHQSVPAMGKENVFGFDVAVHHPVVVRILERLNGLTRDAKRVGERGLVLPSEPVPQALALDVGHGVPEGPRGLAGIEEG
jgi:hypothetical protein